MNYQLDANAVSTQLTKAIAKEADKLNRSFSFRRLIKPNSIEQVEQDRIFNELVANPIVLIILFCGTIKKTFKNKPEPYQYFSELQLFMMNEYPHWLKEIGVPLKFTDLWKKLIELRLNEYRKDANEYKKDLKDDVPGAKWVSIVTTGCYHHIRRGKVDLKDPLFKLVINHHKKILKQLLKILRWSVNG